MFKECNFSRIPIVQPGNEKVMLSLSLSIYRWLEAIYHQTLGKYYILMLYLQKLQLGMIFGYSEKKGIGTPERGHKSFPRAKRFLACLPI